MENSTKRQEQTELKSIDIQGKEWFDKVNGNSYHAGTVTTNFGEENSLSFIIPFQYGYGESYIQSALKVLVKENIIPNRDFIQENNIQVRANIYRNCKKSELKNITL